METKVYTLGDRVEMKKKTSLWELSMGNYPGWGRYQDKVFGLRSYCHAAAVQI